ncbi:MAG: LUD domain-containing protein [Trueperella sp.]|uniref:LutC/YkgG family protein n=1 Tax=Trueperella sp. TaxID=2699835 RepID=UPI0025F2AC46|nr:LUD domain-containing protein [Trueperella sp.]MCI7305145.1 LUD domain-containing protein [Trueperella sp.]MDY5403271.1 LUD domain-containing protein [Trueperella sp.]
MSAKDVILNRIRNVGPIPAPQIPREYRFGTDAPREEVITEMAQALVDYTAVVKRVGPDGIGAAIDELLADCSSVVVPEGLPSEWKEAAGRGREVRVDAPALSKAELNATDAVLTASRVAVANSGTIMLDGEPDQGRRAITLVPDTHVVVLEADAIKATLPEAVAVLGENPARPTTWIAGPSATSDIELVRVDGVHGPRNLRVIIVER